jgi:hypothetical protein
MKQYFGTGAELLDRIDSLRLLDFHATTADMHNPYGIPASSGMPGGTKTIEEMVVEQLRQEASPA